MVKTFDKIKCFKLNTKMDIEMVERIKRIAKLNCITAAKLVRDSIEKGLNEMETKLHNAPIKTELYDGSLNSYQDAAQTTSIYPGKGTFNGLIYTALKMNGEAGELAEKVGKVMRDDLMILSETKREEMAKECGDVLWYVAAVAKELRFTLDDIARINLQKLKDRQERNKLSGSGDNR